MEEDSFNKSVKFSVYVNYFRLVGLRILLAFFVVYIVACFLEARNSFLLKELTDGSLQIQANTTYLSNIQVNLTKYATLGIGNGII